MKYLIFLLLFLGCGVRELSVPNSVESPLIVLMGGRFSCVEDGLLSQADTVHARNPNAKILKVCFGSLGQQVNIATYPQFNDVTNLVFLPEAFELLNKEFSNYNDVRLLGFSYGGWLALATVLQADTHFSSLTTVDPISITCTPDTIAYNSECWKAPTDMINRSEQLKRKTVIWKNYYELVGVPHSSRMPNAKNIFINYTPLDLAAHLRLSYNPIILE